MSPEKAKRKGLGGMTPEKKRLLKQFIMQKAAEEKKKKAEADVKEKLAVIEARVPKLEIEGIEGGIDNLITIILLKYV